MRNCFSKKNKPTVEVENCVSPFATLQIFLHTLLTVGLKLFSFSFCPLCWGSIAKIAV